MTRDLLEYWLQHAEALGTVESMVEWWLLEHRIQHTLIEVQSVLSELVSNGYVVRWRQADGRTFYRLNREKEAEIITWLRSG